MIVRFLLFCTILFMATPTAVFALDLAYLDPGTGSLIVQMIIAGIASALLALKIYWRSFKAFISSRFGKQET